MLAVSSGKIRGIVFDLDGTLYVSECFAAEIQNAAAEYMASIKGVPQAEAYQLMAAARIRLSEEIGTTQTISAVCTDLGGSVQEMHRFFEQNLRPEAFLVRNEQVINLLERLAESFSLYIYTNNNRVLTTRILTYLGLSGSINGIFAIDDTWRAKPDDEIVRRLLEKTGLAANEVLFVGDRYDVDLRVPEQLGCPVYLSQNLEQLLRLDDLLIETVDVGR